MYYSKNYKIISAFTFIALMLFVVTSCNRDAWTSEQKETFLQECDSEGGSGSYCKCYLEKVMEKYPNHADSKNLDFESAVEMAKSCE